jgi:hypothetical protein
MTSIQRNGGAVLGDTVWELPPLILHPFADRASSDRLLENSLNTLIANGFLPANGTEGAELERKLLEGRFAELRMLYFLGKDVVRWTGQCVEFSERIPELSGIAIREQSFATLLTRHMPEAVAQKLQGWGEHDAGVIFARAIALNQIFGAAPAVERLAESFIRHYHRYADSLFACWQQMVGFREITPANFRFELYASGEYTKMLENEWGTGETQS